VEAPEPQEAAPEPAPPAPEAPAPEPQNVQTVRDAKGNVTHRPYVVLQQVDMQHFERLAWHEDADGKHVPAGPGTRRSSIALVRSAADALVLGYKVVGVPEAGARLVAVPLSSFAVKTVKPKPPEPTRTRLSIN
jgi:hypothetical protein